LKRLITGFFFLFFSSPGISETISQEALPLNPFGISDPLIGNPAPPMDISLWINGEGFTLKDLRGKVVVLEFFQLWCPGCNRFSIPLMKKWFEEYGKRQEIQFLSIHTVFEGHSYQTVTRLRQFIRENEINHLVGVDRHSEREPIPVTMKRYNTGGTPSMVILDKRGVVRFKRLGGFKVEPVEELLEDLIADNTDDQE
jgi:thiol-disulfide isomerase/thioredoxin